MILNFQLVNANLELVDWGLLYPIFVNTVDRFIRLKAVYRDHIEIDVWEMLDEGDFDLEDLTTQIARHYMCESIWQTIHSPNNEDCVNILRGLSPTCSAELIGQSPAVITLFIYECAEF